VSPFTSRFAPSPTGSLHLGHAFSALSAYESAKSQGGRFVLRIEDIDHTRCRPAFEAAIYEDLDWLGLSWETPVLRQSQHLTDYQVALERLTERGLTYRCFRTRSQVNAATAPHGPTRAFIGTRLDPVDEARRLAAGHPFAWRLSLEAARRTLGRSDTLTFQEEGLGPGGQSGLIHAQPDLLGDIVLARKDVGVAYHLAVTVDDARQGITHIVRGEDLFEATHIQRLLQALLNLPTPIYRHHRLILGPDGQRLAKRNRAQTLASLRERGVTPAEIRLELGFD
jgi:glutamyl-Q tRNA(Asp) synthetase